MNMFTLEEAKVKLAGAGQEHLLQYFDELDEVLRAEFGRGVRDQFYALNALSRNLFQYLGLVICGQA